MTSSEQKDSVLLSIFGDAYKQPSSAKMKKAISQPKENKQSRANVEQVEIESSSVENSVLRSAKLPNYKEIKALVNRKNKGLSDVDEQLSDWIHSDLPVAAEITSNNVAKFLANDMRENIIPFIQMKTAKNSIFIVRNCDINRFRTSVENTIFNMSNISYIFNYDTFNRLNDKANRQATFITDLSEVQMEAIRRKIALKSAGMKFSIFRMNNDKWGMGMYNDDFFASSLDAQNKICFAEALLYSSIALQGANKDFNIQRLNQDINADRMAAIKCGLSLQYNKSVYIYDPTLPTSALKITKNGFCKVDVVKRNGSFALRETPNIDIHSSAGEYLYRDSLLNMQHKAYVYTASDFMHAYDAWKKRDLRVERQNLSMEYAEHQLAHQIYLAFAKEHEKEPIFVNKSNIAKQVDVFKNEVASVLESLSKNEISLYHSDKDGIEMFNVLSSSGHDLKFLHNVAADIHSFDIRAIKDNTLENYVSLNERLRNMRTNIPTMKDFERNY